MDELSGSPSSFDVVPYQRFASAGLLLVWGCAMVTETFESDGRRHPSLAAFAAERKVLRFHTKRAAIKYFKEQGFKRVLGNNNAWRSDELSAIWVSAPADEPAGFVVMRRVEK